MIKPDNSFYTECGEYTLSLHQNEILPVGLSRLTQQLKSFYQIDIQNASFLKSLFIFFINSKGWCCKRGRFGEKGR